MTNRKNAGAKKVAILVAGMHRSGTSAITRILSILGCALPKTLLAPHPSNERGFWESPEIVDVNREILVSAGSTLEEWRADEWREFDPRWYTSPVADQLRRRARTVLEREFGDSPLFVIKDPRLCRLLPFWVEALESFDARPLVVSPIRNPLDVAESLETRDGIDRSIGHLMWLQHVLSAEADSRDLGRAYFRYDRLLSEPHAVVDRLGDVLGVSWPRRMNDTDEEIDHFLSTRLRHHSNDDTRVMENPRLSHWLRSSFEIFTRWTNGKERTTDTARLDRIKTAFDDAMPAFDRAVSVGLKTTRRLSTAQAELAERGSQITSLKGSLAERHDEVMVLHAKVEDQNRTLAERHDEVMVLHAKVEDQNRTLAERHDEVMVLHAKVEDQNRTLAERHDEVMVLHAKVEDQNRTLAERHDEVMTLLGKVEEIWISSSWRLTRPLRGIKLVLTGRARLTHRLGWRGPTSMMYLTRRFSFHARAFGLASACRRAGTAITARLPIAGRLRGRRRVARASEVAVPAAAIPRDPPPERERHCPRVAMLVRDFHDGGLEKVVFDVTKQFLKQGIVCPILVAGSAGRAAKQAEELGCSVQAFGGDVAELVSAVRENGIEVVITHHCYEPLELLSMADVKLIEVIHNAYCWQGDLSFFSELRGRCVDRFVAVSDFVRDYALTALSVPADRIRVIENGLSRYGLIRPDLRQLSQRRATTVNRPLLVHLANAHPQKNHVAVLRAFERVLADHAGASLVLAGVIDDTTDTGRHVQAEIESRRLHDRVRCVGPLGRRELSRLLADAHIGLLPSVVEGFSIASLEYAYFGLPTVLSDTGAARRLTERYGHAVIADTAALSTEQLESAGIERRALEPDTSTVSGIAAAAGTILENYAQFADMARRAGRDWESYSIEVVAREYRNLLTEAVT